jgi:hypothetical protein
MAAINHLADKTGNTVELVEQLTDEQLTEQLAYYQHRRDTAHDTGDGVYNSAAYNRHRHDLHAATVESEMLKRGLSLDHDSSSSES